MVIKEIVKSKVVWVRMTAGRSLLPLNSVKEKVVKINITFVHYFIL